MWLPGHRLANNVVEANLKLNDLGELLSLLEVLVIPVPWELKADLDAVGGKRLVNPGGLRLMVWQRALTLVRAWMAFRAAFRRAVISDESSGRSPSTVKSRSTMLRGLPCMKRSAFPPLKAMRRPSSGNDEMADSTTNWMKRLRASSEVVLFAFCQAAISWIEVG